MVSVSLASNRLHIDQSTLSRSPCGNSKGAKKTPPLNETVSGYSADQEESTRAGVAVVSGSAPPCLIGLYHKHKRRPADAEDRAKRRKLSELSYDAAMAKLTSQWQDTTALQLNTKRSRVAPFIDLSSVSLVYGNIDSASNSSSSGRTSATCLISDDILTDCGAIYEHLIRQTASSYRGGITMPPRSISPSSCSDSSSSLSDTESDVSQGSSTILVLNARLDIDDDEGIGSAKLQDEPPTMHYIACPSTASISMEDAISFSKFPRLVTRSTSPYTIVFCNAAFSVATGIPSDDALGKNLLDLVAPSNNKPSQSEKLCLELLCAASSSEGDYTSVCCPKNHDMEFRIKVTPIMPSSRKTSSTATPSQPQPSQVMESDVSRDGETTTCGGEWNSNFTHFSVELNLLRRGINMSMSNVGKTAMTGDIRHKQAFLSAMG
ncbi:hypothetical protein MHU86_20848 [Fragilaria crotonensis]|nr:hypothetical protein MHU86_20848 [Fragilaria crotonensis]